MFILKVVKVFCFDTLLQVLILKVVKALGKWRVASDEWRESAQCDKSGLPQRQRGTELRDNPTPPVFCAKSAELLDCKGVGLLESAKEFVRVSNDKS